MLSYAKDAIPYIYEKVMETKTENAIGKWNGRMKKLIENHIGLYSLSPIEILSIKFPLKPTKLKIAEEPKKKLISKEMDINDE